MGSAENILGKSPEIIEEYGPNLKIIETNDQIKELQTILRDRYAYSSYSIQSSLYNTHHIIHVMYIQYYYTKYIHTALLINRIEPIADIPGPG
jgi:hypothetical protein